MNLTRCPHCKTPMKPVLKSNGRTDFRCLECEHPDPVKLDTVKWATGLCADSRHRP
jgi:tRNA(Ile2) C34 agmatinyltransferase TiaS